MAILKKTSFKQNLDQISVYVTDADPNSQYFRVTDLPDTFTGGKNSFLIQGSTNLVPDTLVKIEIKDALGNIIYSEPSAGIPSYYEGTSKVVAVHIYPDTAFGPCTITILGELNSTTIDGINVPVPLDWVGKYNVKWQKVVNVNPFKRNTTPIRFYRRPQVQITESVLPIYNRNVTSLTVSGSVSGTSIIPIQDTDFRTYRGPISYELSTTSSFFSQSMEGFNINVLELSGSYTPSIIDVITDRRALVSVPYYITGSTTDPFYERIRNFSNKPFSLTYDESISITNSNINSSFAKIKITDLETFTGDASRIKVFASSKNDLGDYQLLEDLLLESSEILQVDEFNGTLNVRTGVFSQPVLDSFWQTENITTSPIVSIDNSLLIRSVKLQPTTDVSSPINLQGLFKFTTTGSFQLSRFTEYQLDFTPLMSSSLGNYALLEIYGSGSAFVNTNSSNNFGKFLGELETNNPFRRYDRQQINFQPDTDGDGKIVFLVKAGTWHLSGVSLRAAQESSFSPNEVSLVVNVPTKINNEAFDFKFEIYDINNNYVPITLQTSSIFVGGNDVAVTRNLELTLSNNIFNFSDTSVIPSFITIDFTKSGLTGSVLFASSAVDSAGNEILPQAGFPGALEVIDTDTYKLTASSFTGSISGITVGAISYTASCEDINRYFTIFRTEQGAPAYLFYATADKNNFTFNPDANYKSVVPNDYIDIRLVQQNLPDTAPMGLVINSGSEFGTPPPLYYTSSVGNASIYRLFVSTSSDITPDNSSGYTFQIGQSTYDFELHTIDGIFTSSITIDAISKGDAAKGIIASADKNQFFYKMSDAIPDPNPQSATIFVKRLNLSSPSSSITVNSGSGKPGLILVNENIGSGVAQYSISTTDYPYSAGSTTYYFTGSDSNDIEYIDEITIDALIVKSQIGVLASNENATLPAYSTGFVPSASFIATTGSLQVTVGNETASYSPTLTVNTFSASVSASSGVLNPNINNGTYSIGQLTDDTGSVTIKVSYQDATGIITEFPKVINYSKAKKAAPVLTLNITNNNQTVNAKSTGVQLSEFVTASIEVLETYDGITAAKPINGTPTITTLYGYSNYFYDSASQTIALRTLSTDFEQIGIVLEVTDSENVIRQLEGSISLSKVRNAVPNVEVSLVPVAQTILANSRGSGSASPQPITVTAAEGGTDRFTSIGILSFTNGLTGSVSGNTITLTSNASSMLKDSGSIFVPINYTDGEGNTGLKTIVASVTRVRSAAPLTNISVSPETQTVASGSSGYETPQDVTIIISEVGGSPYTYTSTLGSTINTFSASVTNATINTSTGVITPNTPTTTLGTNASSLVTYINSEGTLLTASVSYSVGVAIGGADGGDGPGVVYRGTYSAGTAYYHTDIRRDIVVYSGQYYIANNTAKSGLTTWSTPPTDWQVFGATFDSVATNILLTADATITRGLVMGTLDGFSGFIRSATATSLTAGKGYYFNYDGSFRFGDTGSSVVLWDGTNLTVSGTIKAQTGSIGGVTIADNSLYTGTGTYGNTNTGFFLSSSGHFSLEDKLTWDPVNNYLNISGTLRANTGSIGGWTIDSSSIFSGIKRDETYNQFNSASMITIGSNGYIVAPGFYISNSGSAVFSGSLRANGGTVLTTTNLLLFTASMHSFTSSVTQSLVDVSSSISASILTLDNAIFTNANGLIDKLPTANTSGLYTGQEYLGYFKVGSGWTSFLSSSGDFYLSGSGTQGLVWNATANTLSIDGRVVARTGLIGGWGIGTSEISSSGTTGGSDGVFTTAGMRIGGSGYISAQNFSISSAGDVKLSGSIAANAGFIGGWVIGASSISTTNLVGGSDGVGTTTGVVLSKDGWISAKNFTISSVGNVSMTGTVTATSGAIGSWIIDTDSIYVGTKRSSTYNQFNSASMITIGSAGYISAPGFFITTTGLGSFSGSLRANGGQLITTTNLLLFTSSVNNFTASVTQSLIDASSSISQSIYTTDQTIFTNANGLIDKLPTPGTSGLYTGQEYLGYFKNGSGWTSFLSSSGEFYLSGSSTTGLVWRPQTNTLSVDGRVVARDGLVGGWKIGTVNISSSNYVAPAGGANPDSNFTSAGIIFGSTGYISGQNFSISSAGTLKLSGSIAANGGFIGGWIIDGSSISSVGASGGGDGSFTNSGIKLNKDGWISSEKFFISSSGDVSFGGKLSYGVRGSGVNIMPLVWRYDPKDVSGLAASNYENLTLNGVATDNAINYGTDPFGKQSLLWECYPSGDGNADGGWNSTPTEIDYNKTYKFITYVKINNNADGDLYFGFYSYNASNQLVSSSFLNGTYADNTYFFFSQNPSGTNAMPFTNRWYLIVGYVHGIDYSGTTNMGGVYDVESGRKVFECYDFKWKTDGVNQIAKAAHRCYHFYNTLGNGSTLYQQMFGPAVYEVDGSEPDLNRLLDKAQSLADGKGSGSFFDGKTFYAPIISGSSGDFTGRVTATSGLIGGWLIDSDRLYSSGSGSNNIIKMKLEPNYVAPQFTLSDTNGDPAVVIKTGQLIDLASSAATISITWNADKTGPSGTTTTSLNTYTYNNSASFTVSETGLYTANITTTGISDVGDCNTGFSGYMYVGVGYQIASDAGFTNILSQGIVSSFSRTTAGQLDIPAGNSNVEITFLNTGTHYIRSYWYRTGGGINPTVTWNSAVHNFPNFTLEKVIAYTELTDFGFQSIRSNLKFVKIQRVGTTDTMLQVGGDITATGNITAYSSDRRLKTNINILQNPLEKLNKLSGFTYNWNDKANQLVGYDTNESIVGMFAQDVQEVLPEAVKIAPFDNDGNGNSKSGENYLTIQYEKVVPLLVEAIKELKNEIEELKKNK